MNPRETRLSLATWQRLAMGNAYLFDVMEKQTEAAIEAAQEAVAVAKQWKTRAELSESIIEDFSGRWVNTEGGRDVRR